MLSVTEADDVVEVSSDAVTGDIADLRWAVHDGIRAGARTVVVDLRAVDSLSSAAIAVLIGAHRRCRARGGKVVLRDANRRTTDLLLRTGLWRVLALERRA